MYNASLNNNQSNFVDYAEDYETSVYMQVITGVFYSTSFVLGVGSNSLVLLVIVYFQRIVVASNFFIFTLAISDLIFVLLCIPTTYITAYLMSYWPFSEFACIFLNFMQSVSVTITVYTLICITMDKYWALCNPFKLRMSRKCSKILVLATVVFALIVSLPIGMYTQLMYFDKYIENGNESTNQTVAFHERHPQCTENWPDSLKNYTQLYNFLLLIIQYLLPVVILTYCYARIGLVLKRAKAPGESIKERDEKMLVSRKRMITMSFFMVLSFIVSWAPMQIITLYRFYDEMIVTKRYFSWLFFACHWLAVSRSFINPFIYACNNQRFRKGFAYFIFCYFYSKSPSQYETEITKQHVAMNKRSKKNKSFFARSHSNVEFIHSSTAYNEVTSDFRSKTSDSHSMLRKASLKRSDFHSTQYLTTKLMEDERDLREITLRVPKRSSTKKRNAVVNNTGRHLFSFRDNKQALEAQRNQFT